MTSLMLTTSLVLSSCKHISPDEVPVSELRVPLVRDVVLVDGKPYYDVVCDIREVTNKQTLASKRKLLGTMLDCEGIWGLTAKDFSVVRSWLKGVLK